MGPAQLPPGHGMDVRPHPHIGLATVTYLFEGMIEHRDSLGSLQVIEPGAINWMTAGRGIVHSERTPTELRQSGSRIEGIQCWVALPQEHEETEPTFAHHPADTLPEFEKQGVVYKLLLGKALGHESPVKVHSDLFYIDSTINKDIKFTFPTENREGAVYVIQGSLKMNGQIVEKNSLAVGESTEDIEIEATSDARVLFLGGATVGPRFIYWNLVSSSEQRLAEAQQQWSLGPGNSERFPSIPGDDQEFIPLPTDGLQNPKGTPL
ncbi:MAG: pirin family protein [Bdellovibrionales bacterium]|nr:pirin family protein [Bdellovibrionales bacterium]